MSRLTKKNNKQFVNMFENFTIEDLIKLKKGLDDYNNKSNDFILITAPRTEQDILNDFEKLGWKITRENKQIKYNFITRKEYETYNEEIILTKKISYNTYGNICYYHGKIAIDKTNRTYHYYDEEDYIGMIVDMQLHKLLNELFICWGWL